MSLEKIKKSVIKKYGEGTVMNLSDSASKLVKPICTTGFMELDRAIGIAGYPLERMVEIFGPESCIAGDSYIPFEVWSKDDKIRRNHKGGTIRRLYERFNNCVCDESPKQGRHLQNNDSKFYVKSVNDDNCIVRNEILDVVKTGIKRCFRVETEDGQVLYSTAEHKYLTPDGFFPLDTIEVGNEIFVHNNTRVKGRKRHPNKPEVFVKYHPFAPTKIVNNCLYYRNKVSRIVYEAYMNNLSYDEYVNALNTYSKEEINKFNFLPKNIHVHHEDENFRNNELTNLILIDPSEHGKLHSKDRIKNLSFVTVPSKVVTIMDIGDRETFDLKCAYPYNNYIADGIVVHNSGKTTLALHACKEMQKIGGDIVYIDVEHALDPNYAEKGIGVKVNDILISQPDYGEQAVDIVLHVLQKQKENNKRPMLIVLDSVDALMPKKELDGDFDLEAEGAKKGGGGMGLRARLMSDVCRQVTSNLKGSNSTVIFINQIRMKIGVMFGSPETTSGGNALKYYASLRLDIRNIGQVKIGDNPGNQFRVRVKKNKVAPPFKEYEGLNIHGKGFQPEWDLFTLLKDTGKIEKKGSWFTLKDNKKKFQGYGGFLELMEDDSFRQSVETMTTM